MTDSLLLSLRASQKVDPEKDSLPFLISRITEQRGSFRNITEQSLREEIRAQEIGQADTIEESEEVEHVQDAKSRREELATARDEMLRQVTYVMLSNFSRRDSPDRSQSSPQRELTSFGLCVSLALSTRTTAG